MANQTGDSYPDDDLVVTRAGDCESESVLQSIVMALADATNRPATDLPPLYEQIDPSAINPLIDHARRQDTDIRIEFRYRGHRVVVMQDGHVRVYDV
ncbi:hypothetical protein D8Y22_10855 [Salinadaptatus halalkaliphilus]|uniref:Halobacterial output domain-containing protein n=1 Tax=Salinadaptatus halalkaliphilus TaxID=2419781 RepID=A0A4S3TL25_9EURY|nr:HalOD1 output domain-containing protein [Salinadaptatus halalkaliphilus]THE64862.1 hypothetical protein D8Y22_10855 [Salinadaptatus halalkaliphilus]